MPTEAITFVPTEVIVAVITLVQAIGVAIIAGLFSRNAKKTAEYRQKTEKYRQIRAEKDRLREERDTALYELVLADSTGTEVLLHQAHGEKLNGNVESALHGIATAKASFQSICTSQAAKI